MLALTMYVRLTKFLAPRFGSLVGWNVVMGMHKFSIEESKEPGIRGLSNDRQNVGSEERGLD